MVAAAAAYAGWASGTAPFTPAADLAVSVPAGLLALGLVAGWRRRGPRRQRHDEGSVVPWVVLTALVVAVELVSYFHGGPRRLSPTLSSGAETLFRHRPVKAAAFFGWLVGGGYLVTR